MNEVKAYEVEGRLFGSKIEARSYTLDVGLKKLFQSRDGYQIMREILTHESVRNELARLIQEFDGPEENLDEN